MLPADLTAPDAAHGRGAPLRSIALAKAIYIMVHPEDERLRGEAMVTIAAEAIGKYQTAPEKLLADAGHHLGDDATARQQIDAIARESLVTAAREFFEPAGGFSAVATAKGTEFILEKSGGNLSKLLFAGLALTTLHQLAHHVAPAIRGGASLRKVWWLLEKECPITAPKHSRRMMDIWDGYKNAAHLGAAVYALSTARGRQNNDTRFLFSELPVFLRIAKRFEEFGLTFKPDHVRNPSPILDPERVWRLPPNVVASEELMPAGLSVRAQSLLLAYRAPTAP